MADIPPAPDSKNDIGDYPGMPRWVKVLGMIALVVVLLFVILMFTRGPGGRGHGPGRHLSSGQAGGQAPLSSISQDYRTSDGELGDHTQSEGGHW